MEEETVEQASNYRWGTILSGSCLVILFMVFCALTITIGVLNKDRFSQFTDVSPTPAPTVVVTPQILIEPSNDTTKVKFEGFSSNRAAWSLYYPNGKVEVINEKLILQSNISGYPAIGENQEFISTSQTYYVQGDFATDTEAHQPYGLVFGFNSSIGTFYTFQIFPQAEGFQLFKREPGTWEELIPFSRGDIKEYPEVNTLGVYFEDGTIELYVNGELISTYTDEEPLQFSGVGVLVGDSGYRLIVDNFFAYSE